MGRQLELATDNQTSKVTDSVVAMHRNVMDISDRYDRDMLSNLEKLHDHMGQVEGATLQHRQTLTADMTVAHRGMEDTLEKQHRSRLDEFKDDLTADIKRSCNGVQKALTEALRGALAQSVNEPMMSL